MSFVASSLCSKLLELQGCSHVLARIKPDTQFTGKDVKALHLIICQNMKVK